MNSKAGKFILTLVGSQVLAFLTTMAIGEEVMEFPFPLVAITLGAISFYIYWQRVSSQGLSARVLFHFIIFYLCFCAWIIFNHYYYTWGKFVGWTGFGIFTYAMWLGIKFTEIGEKKALYFFIPTFIYIGVALFGLMMFHAFY